jgi:protein tyrosine phosphatase (PTP) superfamily phosphohydrolase (DUF442 family)
MPRRFWLVPLLIFCLVASGCMPSAATQPAATQPGSASLSDGNPKVEAAGLHNVYRITDKLYSGSSPDGEEGFRSLEKLGVRTVVSVDGARPDVEVAHRHGMRYVHLPIGYDGMSQDQALRVAKAARDLPGPVYIHCHHGVHRGPTAAAVAHLALDEKCSVQQAIGEMQRAGTDPHYKGLYAAPAAFQRPSAQELDAVAGDFVEVAPVEGLVPFLVGLDERVDHLKQIRAAGWKTPPNQPDLDPPHEALQMLEQYREARRLPELRERPDAFHRLLADAEKSAQELDAALRRGKEAGPLDTAAVDKCFAKATAACTACHNQYRDVRDDRKGD